MQRKAHRVRRFWRSEPQWALAGLATVTALMALWMFAITWLRHRAWFSQNYDIGIFDQAMWLISHFREPFVTVRVINIFGDHANFALIILAPFYRLWFDRVVPLLGKVLPGGAAYTYLPASVRRFPGPQELAALLERSGFAAVRFRLFAGGIVALHVAEAGQ